MSILSIEWLVWNDVRRAPSGPVSADSPPSPVNVTQTPAADASGSDVDVTASSGPDATQRREDTTSELPTTDAPVPSGVHVPEEVVPSQHSEPPVSSASQAASPSTAIGEPAVPPAAEATRRVRLNPTISPDFARPIPSIKDAGTSPPAPPARSSFAPAAAPPSYDTSIEDRETTSETPAEAALPSDVTAGRSEVEQGTADFSAAVETPFLRKSEPVEIPKADSLDSDLEAALEAAMSTDVPEDVVTIDDAEMEPEDAPANDDAAAPAVRVVRKGARLQGSVQSIHGDDMFIELGHRLPGVLSRRQFGLRKQPMQGEPIEVVVTRIDEKEGLIHCNLPRGAAKPAGNWEEVTTGQTVECIVSQTNKGGLEVTIGSLRGFMPASQVELGFAPDLQTYVGQKLRARVTEVNPKRRKLVVSRRSLMEEERQQSEQEMLQKLAPGQHYTGRVKTIKDYGAFVDIGGIDGLVHVGQISWNRINHPSEMLKEGQEVEVQVLSVDPEKKKVGLGMRQLTQNPWANIEQRFASGISVRGKVTRIEAFGAFVELEDGVEGLVHISELDHKRINRVTEVLSVGQETEVKVLEVDPKKKRISLSVKALIEAPQAAAPADDAPPLPRRSRESLKGGIGEPTGGHLFGDPRQFGK